MKSCSFSLLSNRESIQCQCRKSAHYRIHIAKWMAFCQLAQHNTRMCVLCTRRKSQNVNLDNSHLSQLILLLFLYIYILIPTAYNRSYGSNRGKGGWRVNFLPQWVSSVRVYPL